MTDERTTSLVLLGVTLVALASVLLLGVVVLRSQRRTRRELDAAHEATAALRADLDVALRGTPDAPVPPSRGRVPGRRGEQGDLQDDLRGDYVITQLGRDGAPVPDGADVAEPVAARIDGRLFADVVLRETLVRAASATYGVRRALAPETRNRVRFEVRREVRRSRKERRADLKQARRDLHARQRAAQGVGSVPDEDVA
ncbi:hypothetical protein [Nocardioides alkalitolerans]|uniref:hypothetical protein n=1 Tax=Nocardioides alkalitolerans TaxID=281714 RepID=UPI0003FB0BB1|nr:hypothetical protein [Nocardioides alkalitolerans]